VIKVVVVVVVVVAKFFNKNFVKRKEDNHNIDIQNEQQCKQSTVLHVCMTLIYIIIE